MATPSYESVAIAAEGGAEEDVLVVYNKEGEYITKGQSPITIEGLTPGTTYSVGHFKVAYRNSAKESQPVEVQSFKTKSIPVNSIVLNTTEISFWDRRFSSHQLSATAYPINATDKRVVFSIEKPVEGLDVTKDGLIYVSDKLASGDYKIKVSSFDGSTKVFCNLTIKRSLVTWTVDFKNKMANSLVENPNIAKSNYATTLLPPNSQTFAERTQAEYAKLMSLDGDVLTLTNTVLDTTRQVLEQYNLVQELERKLGTGIWQGRTSFIDKANIAKQLTSSLVLANHARGSSPSGTKVMLSRFNTGTGNWGVGDTNATANIALLTSNLNTQSQIETTIDNNGMINFLLHAEKSDGTVASIVSVDYVSLTITVDLSRVVVLTTSQTMIG